MAVGKGKEEWGIRMRYGHENVGGREREKAEVAGSFRVLLVRWREAESEHNRLRG